MSKKTKAAVTVALITTLLYGVLLFERWQRPEDVKKLPYSVDTLTDI